MRNECLRDRLVSGIRDSKMITELLIVKLAELFFDLAVQKFLAIKQDNKDFQVLQGEQELSAQLHTLDPSNQREPEPSPEYLPKQEGSRGKDRKAPKSCYRCTGSHHPNKCPFNKESCFHCGIIEHTHRACRKNQAAKKNAKTQPFLVLVHVHRRDFNIFSSHGLLPSDLVAQSVEQR